MLLRALRDLLSVRLPLLAATALGVAWSSSNSSERCLWCATSAISDQSGLCKIENSSDRAGKRTSVTSASGPERRKQECCIERWINGLIASNTRCGVRAAFCERPRHWCAAQSVPRALLARV